MLYVTTRNKTDSFTAHKVLRDGFASDGGQFAPLRLPVLSQEQVKEIMQKPFCEAVAEVLNLFFSVRLTGWDVEFAIGRRPVKMNQLGSKIIVAEFWNNPDHSMDYIAGRVYQLLCGEAQAENKPVGWASVAIRIAFLFGTFAELKREGIEVADISVAGQDFESGISAWYARKMGLPVSVIICGTNENCSVWDLIHKGQVDTGAAVVTTNAPDMDQITPAGVERLIYEVLGLAETGCYLQKINDKAVYHVPVDMREQLSWGLVSSVVGDKRIVDLISSAYQTYQYLIDPYMAVCYGALQDYRSKCGENRMTLMLSEEAPVKYAKIIETATGLKQRDISIR